MINRVPLVNQSLLLLFLEECDSAVVLWLIAKLLYILFDGVHPLIDMGDAEIPVSFWVPSFFSPPRGCGNLLIGGIEL